eukprot:c24947_g1_i1 orf=118-600(-)
MISHIPRKIIGRGLASTFSKKLHLFPHILIGHHSCYLVQTADLYTISIDKAQPTDHRLPQEGQEGKEPEGTACNGANTSSNPGSKPHLPGRRTLRRALPASKPHLPGRRTHTRALPAPGSKPEVQAIAWALTPRSLPQFVNAPSPKRPLGVMRETFQHHI